MSDQPPARDDSDIAALQALLLWMRAEGFGVENLQIGKIQLIGLRDYDPKPIARAAAVDEAVTAYDHWGADMPRRPA